MGRRLVRRYDHRSLPLCRPGVTLFDRALSDLPGSLSFLERTDPRLMYIEARRSTH
jgi:hypothetical protein